MMSENMRLGGEVWWRPARASGEAENNWRKKDKGS